MTIYKINDTLNIVNKHSIKLTMELSTDNELKMNIAEWAIWNKNYPTCKNNQNLNVVWVRPDYLKVYLNIDMIEKYNSRGLFFATEKNLIKDLRQEWWNWANVTPFTIIPIGKIISDYSTHDLNYNIEDCELINIFSEWLNKQNLSINDVYKEFYEKTNINLELSWETLNMYEDEMNENKSLNSSEYNDLVNQLDIENKTFVKYLELHSVYSPVINKIKNDSYSEMVNFVMKLIMPSVSMSIEV